MLNYVSHFQTITEIYETTTTRTTTSDYEQSEPSKPALAQPVPAQPVTTKPVERKKVIRKKLDSSKFMTPYIVHSQKMQELFSPVSFKQLLLIWFYYWESTDSQPAVFGAGWILFLSLVWDKDFPAEI